MCGAGPPELLEGNGKRAIAELWRPDTPRPGKSVDVGDGIPVTADDVSEAFEVVPEDVVLDLGLLAPLVDSVVPHWNQKPSTSARAVLNLSGVIVVVRDRRRGSSS